MRRHRWPGRRKAGPRALTGSLSAVAAGQTMDLIASMGRPVAGMPPAIAVREAVRKERGRPSRQNLQSNRQERDLLVVLAYWETICEFVGPTSSRRHERQRVARRASLQSINPARSLGAPAAPRAQRSPRISCCRRVMYAFIASSASFGLRRRIASATPRVISSWERAIECHPPIFCEMKNQRRR